MTSYFSDEWFNQLASKAKGYMNHSSDFMYFPCPLTLLTLFLGGESRKCSLTMAESLGAPELVGWGSGRFFGISDWWWVHSDFLDFPPRTDNLMHTVNGRNPAPAWAYLTMHYDLYVRTPFSMLCVSDALCAGAGFQSFDFFVLGTVFSYQC